MSGTRFKPVGDTELWVLGSGGRKIPMFVKPGVLSDHSAAMWVTPGVPLNGQQIAFAHSHLDEVAIKRANDAWIMRVDLVRTKLTKAPGITPSYYLAWDTPEPLGEVPEPEQPVSDADLPGDVAFVQATCARRGITNLPQATLYYHAFCQTALEWLLDDRKPLNIGFATIHALPYRINWREIIAAKFPALGRLLTGPARDATLTAMDFDAHLRSAALTSMSRDGTTFGWSLFIEPGSAWEKYTMDYERASFTEHSPESYAGRWAYLVHEARERALGLLVAFYRAASDPNGTVDRRLPEDRRRLLVARQGRVRPAAPPLPITRAVLPEQGALGEAREDALDVGEDEDLWEMPDVELQADDMRNDRREEPKQ